MQPTGHRRAYRFSRAITSRWQGSDFKTHTHAHTHSGRHAWTTYLGVNGGSVSLWICRRRLVLQSDCSFPTVYICTVIVSPAFSPPLNKCACGDGWTSTSPWVKGKDAVKQTTWLDGENPDDQSRVRVMTRGKRQWTSMTSDHLTRWII